MLWACRHRSRATVDVRVIHPTHVDLPYDDCLLFTAIMSCSSKGLAQCPQISHRILSSYQVAGIFRGAVVFPREPLGSF